METNTCYPCSCGTIEWTIVGFGGGGLQTGSVHSMILAVRHVRQDQTLNKNTDLLNQVFPDLRQTATHNIKPNLTTQQQLSEMTSESYGQ